MWAMSTRAFGLGTGGQTQQTLLSEAGPVAGLGSNHPRDLFDRMIIGIHS
jgi:hypothetical protein